MLEYQQRVVEEEAELRKKFDRLETFIAGEAFGKLPQEDQWLLQEQRGYMSGYLSVLLRRIDRFVS